MTNNASNSKHIVQIDKNNRPASFEFGNEPNKLFGKKKIVGRNENNIIATNDFDDEYSSFLALSDQKYDENIIF